VRSFSIIAKIGFPPLRIENPDIYKDDEKKMARLITDVLSGVKFFFRDEVSSIKVKTEKNESTDSHRTVSLMSFNNIIHGRIAFLGILYRHATAFYVLAEIYY